MLRLGLEFGLELGFGLGLVDIERHVLFNRTPQLVELDLTRGPVWDNTMVRLQHNRMSKPQLLNVNRKPNLQFVVKLEGSFNQTP